MTAGSSRAALDAVHAARPIVARLSPTRHKEDLAADIIEAEDWLIEQPWPLMRMSAIRPSSSTSR